MLAVARLAAGLEPPAAADEAQAAEPLPAVEARELPAARPLLAEAREPQAVEDEAREAPRSQAPRGRESPREPDEARTAPPLLAQGREQLAAELARAGLLPAVAPRHLASALEDRRALALEPSAPGRGTLEP